MSRKTPTRLLVAHGPDRNVGNLAGAEAAGARLERKELIGDSGDGDQQPGLLRLAVRPLHVQGSEPLCLSPCQLAVGDDRCLVVAIAALQSEDRRKALFEPRELRGVVIDRLRQLASRRRDVRDVRLEAFEAFTISSASRWSLRCLAPLRKRRGRNGWTWAKRAAKGVSRR